MCDRIESVIVAKQSKTASNADTEAVKAESMRLDDEIHQFMDKLAYADSIVLSYIQERIKEFHGKKSDSAFNLNAEFDIVRKMYGSFTQ
jgi:cell division protein FtsB